MGVQNLHKIMQENIDQVALCKWICSGLKIPEVRELRGDAGYLLNNMIAKYTLAADSYQISTGALREFKERKVDLKAVYSRRTFYGRLNGNPFIYEHAVPAIVVRKALLSLDPKLTEIRKALAKSGFVAVLLRDEDKMIGDSGYRSKMPSGWKLGDDTLARYHASGVQLSKRVLNVSGAICR